MAELIEPRSMNIVISHLEGVRNAVHDEAESIGDAARADLERLRATTRWHKIYGPGHLTRITVSQGDVDSFTNLEGPHPMAIEFGHRPSGVFGPGGSLGHIKTKAPEGLYILHRAAGFGLG